MLCKIATSTASVKPPVWRQVRPGSSGAHGVVSPSETAPAETAEVKKRLAELERDRQTELAQTRQTAFEQGLRQGREESSKEIKASSERLAQTLADLVSWKRKLRAEAEADLLKLSLAVARRILRRELLTDPDAMQGLVYAALQKIQKREIWRARVYPAGVDAIRSCLENIGAASIEVIADPSLKPGDLLIETASGELDASVDTQLLEIERGFADRLCLR